MKGFFIVKFHFSFSIEYVSLLIQDSYDEKGYNIYAYVNDHEDIDIDFVKAKSLGASYVFSRKKVNHNKLDVICENCFDNKFMNLYLLN